jgi:hypothetical protein
MNTSEHLIGIFKPERAHYEALPIEVDDIEKNRYTDCQYGQGVNSLYQCSSLLILCSCYTSRPLNVILIKQIIEF